MGKKSRDLFTTMPSARGRNEKGEIHKCLALQWELHRAAAEINFREGTKLKHMMAIVIGKEINRIEGIQAWDTADRKEEVLSFTFPSAQSDIHTSFFMPKELYTDLKKVSHYTGISASEIITNGLALYLLNEYGEKYPDLVQPIKNQKYLESK